MPWSQEYRAGLAETAAALDAIARQLRIRNAIELARVAGQAGWTGAQLDDMARRLHLDIDTLTNPKEQA